ncbi:hypothetical protein KCH_64500 [Kitasatospora cheerisanensis KCTC 2395]|uniref:Uncharacterized protein n=1 Tax=Kitasatospora cheerisanensis KCTC 2395 TaxID=1348663 RepID=A0A066YUZ7_9ACTN|nr:hypothetical protein KCH_64500 [Kitasatospora cheerisanensis KCTC 2395]
MTTGQPAEPDPGSEEPEQGAPERGAEAEEVVPDLAERVRRRNRNSRINGAGRKS